MEKKGAYSARSPVRKNKFLQNDINSKEPQIKEMISYLNDDNLNISFNKLSNNSNNAKVLSSRKRSSISVNRSISTNLSQTQLKKKKRVKFRENFLEVVEIKSIKKFNANNVHTNSIVDDKNGCTCTIW
jgi:hypothetical protein